MGGTATGRVSAPTADALPDPPGPVGAVIRLPDPSLVVLIGAAGAGKSTLAARLFAADDVLSSDAHRAIVAGDEADQRATRTAFSILHRRLDQRLAAGHSAVVDATNVQAHASRSLLRRAAARGVPAVAIVLDLPAIEVLARNAARPGRSVPEAVVRRQLDGLARSAAAAGSIAGGLAAEGFAAVHLVRSAAALDTLAVEWVRVRPSPPR